MIAALLVAGCGSGDSGPLTKSEFVQQANAICKQAAAERDAALRNVPTRESKEGEFVTEAALPSVQTMTKELAELVPPAHDAKEVQAIVDAFKAGIQKVKVDPTDFVADVAAFGKANRLAEGYGLTECTI